MMLSLTKDGEMKKEPERLFGVSEQSRIRSAAANHEAPPRCTDCCNHLCGECAKFGCTQQGRCCSRGCGSPGVSTPEEKLRLSARKQATDAFAGKN